MLKRINKEQICCPVVFFEEIWGGKYPAGPRASCFEEYWKKILQCFGTFACLWNGNSRTDMGLANKMVLIIVFRIVFGMIIRVSVISYNGFLKQSYSANCLLCCKVDCHVNILTVCMQHKKWIISVNSNPPPPI